MMLRLMFSVVMVYWCASYINWWIQVSRADENDQNVEKNERWVAALFALAATTISVTVLVSIWM